MIKKLFTEKAGDEPNASLSFTAFQELYGDAVANDPFLQRESSEWVRRVRQSGQPLVCCPEDVRLSKSCKHPMTEVCLRCEIPMCHERSRYIKRHEHSLTAVGKDNLTSYAHTFIVEEKVTWLETTIVCPIFTGWITYYMKEQTHQHAAVVGAIDI